jgi:hypothetical protein
MPWLGPILWPWPTFRSRFVIDWREEGWFE